MNAIILQAQQQAQRLGLALLQQKQMVAIAESCTGGLIAAAITSQSGSSQWFERGYITYSNAAKIEDLNVNSETLNRYGAVSEQAAMEMATGVLGMVAGANIALSTTGVAGPTGATQGKPVGMVCFGFARRVGEGVVAHALTHVFEGDRQAIQQQAALFALEQGLYLLQAPDTEKT